MQNDALTNLRYPGYTFPNLATISPFTEIPKEGPTYNFCSQLAKRLQCHVSAGFPERIVQEEKGGGQEYLAANAAMVVAPDGSLVSTYRKTNLFEMDVPWAQPGEDPNRWTISLS